MVEKISSTIKPVIAGARNLSASNLNKSIHGLDNLEKKVSELEAQASFTTKDVIIRNTLAKKIEAFTMVPVRPMTRVSTNIAEMYLSSEFDVVGKGIGLFAITGVAIESQSVGHGKLNGITLCRVKDLSGDKGFPISLKLNEDFTGDELAEKSNLGDWIAFDYVAFSGNEYYALVHNIKGYHLVKNVSMEDIPPFSFIEFKNDLEIDKPSEDHIAPSGITDESMIENGEYALIRKDFPKWVATKKKSLNGAEELTVGGIIGPKKNDFVGATGHFGYEILTYVEVTVEDDYMALVNRASSQGAAIAIGIYKATEDASVGSIKGRRLKSDDSEFGEEITFKVLP